ncbi:arylsulfatase [Ruficoccus sp. ZRK36]|uniref:arylsulfatase n=1 Tax=Ruficoccus sp. ZRK36 TaxID=2866311 RepID=UPI001C72BC1C|nr:arylsulfatase [Ruficoccus sp. ZRK36]QYY35981.1 arylsulfatase [Ruficoccus sp. ZRK36]
MNSDPAKKPNVILIMTDDQGYGDLACTGNPWINTPNIDRLHGDSYRLTDFHVAPLCTPTRGGMMTGRYPARNGAWATAWGRSILRADQVLMPEVFRASGYATGLFGKWHLGDSYPYRPQDRGFEKVVAHRGGGVGQVPDFWGNSYFDDTYFHNGDPVEHNGYCTDVWFDEAMAYIRENKDADRPFFCYLATNAPHDPYRVADRYAAPYRGNPEIANPEFYGMITNIDENVGRLEGMLQETGLAENTVLIFMTDNGTSGGMQMDEDEFCVSGYNAGMRGRKASVYEGGHRVPFFIRWPQGGMQGGVDIPSPANYIDLLPTFIELFGLEPPADTAFDGQSFRAQLSPDAPAPEERNIFVNFRQNTEPPRKWDTSMMRGPWRLVKGRELYHIGEDPGQRKDVAAEHPELAAQMLADYEAYWAEVEEGLKVFCPLYLGCPEENPVRLDAMDVMGDMVWRQENIIRAQTCSGRWNVKVVADGKYRFKLQRWPEELDLSIDAPVANDDRAPCEIIAPSAAKIRLGDVEATVPVKSGEVFAEITAELKAGEDVLEAYFLDEAGQLLQGAYYVYIERL